jgi:cytochrome c oxidase assembly factor CtaG
MNATDYFLNPYNWSFIGLLCLIVFILAYLLLFKTTSIQKVLFCTAMVLIYLVLGSPISNLTNYGLHSITMLQHILLLMVSPILILKSLPLKSIDNDFFNKLGVFNEPKKYFAVLWVIGALVMWLGHFLSAAIMSSKYGLVICGIYIPKNSFLLQIPEASIYTLLFIAGFLMALPVFHPNKNKRLHPIKSVMYLFTACVSCSVLGLYVTFMAASTPMVEAIPVFASFRNPIPMSVRTDQEIAGLMMWVPGCILYVISSVEILFHWYDDNPTLDKIQQLEVAISDK